MTRSQRGAMLIEALLAIIVFSAGILGVLNVVAKMSVSSADSRYRVEAAQYAESIIAEMRAYDPTARKADYSTGGSKFTSWTTRISASTALPLAGAPTSVKPLVVSFDTPGTTVTVTINWRAPQDKAVDTSNNGVPHSYVTTTFFN